MLICYDNIYYPEKNLKPSNTLAYYLDRRRRRKQVLCRWHLVLGGDGQLVAIPDLTIKNCVGQDDT